MKTMTFRICAPFPELPLAPKTSAHVVPRPRDADHAYVLVNGYEDLAHFDSRR